MSDFIYRQMLGQVDWPTAADTATAAPDPGSEAEVLLPPPNPSSEDPVSEPVTLVNCHAGEWDSREQAYQTLEQLANYLARVEPHSPTPYLIRRAVQWGRMSLPEVMDEFIRKDGDLQRFRSFILAEPGQ